MSTARGRRAIPRARDACWLDVRVSRLLSAHEAPVRAHGLQMAGLSQPVEILRDRWGINHIYAQNEADLFFAQGYAAAKDRLFQFEMWRRQATGTVAEILGRREAGRDRGARLHMFRGDLDDELNRYHPRGKAIVEAYVRGVNAYIAETERNAALLPIEFRMLGITPGRWTPAVVISRHQALTVERQRGSAIDARDQGDEPRAGAIADVFPGRRSALRARCGHRPEDLPRRRAGALHRVPRPASSSARGRVAGVPRHLAPDARPFACADRRRSRRARGRSTPIRATSARTTGWCRDRGPSAPSRSWPTIRIGSSRRRRCATGCTWSRRAGT